MAEVLLVATVLAAATLLRTTVGFGDALFAMPLLTMLIGVRAAVPVVLAVSLTIAILVVWSIPRAVALGDVGRLLQGALPGVAVGVVLLRSVPESVLSGVLGVLVAAFGVWRLTRMTDARLHADQSTERSSSTTAGGGGARLAGFISGAFGSATGAGGPPVVLYAMVKGWLPQRFRATLQAFFLCSGALTAVGYAWAGLWTATTVQLYAVALPGVLIALAVGDRIARRLPVERFAGLVAATVTVLGLALIVGAVG